MINVVHITENPIAGAPINLSNALNKYQSDKIRSRHIAQSDRNENRVFDSDIIVDQEKEGFLRDILEQADIIHLHNFYQNQHLFRKHPKLWDVVMKKKRVWQAHTQRDISWMSMEDGLNDKRAKHLVIGQYHPRMYPECEVVPNVIDIFEQALMPDWSVKNEIPRVVYSPSRIRCKGWDNKGYDETIPVLQRLVDDRRITAEIIFNVTHNECLSKRRRADISIDEIVTGSYHLVSLESLSAGLVTIAGLDTIQIATLEHLTGSRELPWVIAGPKTLEEKIRCLVSDPEYVMGARARSRAWMEKYWNPKVTTEKFIKIYESL